MQQDSTQNISSTPHEAAAEPVQSAVEQHRHDDVVAPAESRHEHRLPVERDTLREIITVAPAAPGDTLIDTDLDRALAASAYHPATDMAALRKTVPPPPPS